MNVQVAVNERKKPKQSRSRAMVEVILEAAARVLVDEGFARTTTNRIADRAGVSIGSLYQYFPGREAVVAAVARRHSEALKVVLEMELARTAGMDLPAVLGTMIDAIFAARVTSPELTAVLLDEVPRLGDLDWKAENLEQGYRIALDLLLRHAHELRPNLHLEDTAFVVATMVEGVVNAAAKTKKQQASSGRLARTLQCILINYLQKPQSHNLGVIIP